MPRNLRTIEPGFAHHITQRGVDRQKVFFTAADRNNYLALMQENLADTGVSVLAYCLMSNHVHWILVPERENSLAILLRRVHGRYAQYLNVRRSRTGHLWQNRFFSCVVAPTRLLSAMRYVELNPVRAGLVRDPAAYRWSSASSHLQDSPAQIDREIPLERSLWREGGGAPGWRELLEGGDRWTEVVELRSCTYSGKPNGPEEFVRSIETRFGRCWIGRGRGRKSQDSLEEAERSASSSGSSKGSGSG